MLGKRGSVRNLDDQREVLKAAFAVPEASEVVCHVRFAQHVQRDAVEVESPSFGEMSREQPSSESVATHELDHGPVDCAQLLLSGPVPARNGGVLGAREHIAPGCEELALAQRRDPVVQVIDPHQVVHDAFVQPQRTGHQRLAGGLGDLHQAPVPQRTLRAQRCPGRTCRQPGQPVLFCGIKHLPDRVLSEAQRQREGRASQITLRHCRTQACDLGVDCVQEKQYQDVPLELAQPEDATDMQQARLQGAVQRHFEVLPGSTHELVVTARHKGSAVVLPVASTSRQVRCHQARHFLGAWTKGSSTFEAGGTGGTSSARSHRVAASKTASS